MVRFPCTDRCRRGSLRFPGRRDRAPGCAQFHGSSCECGRGFHRRRDSAQCHLQEEKSFVCLVFLTTVRERETILRADPVVVHQILYSTDCFFHNWANQLPRETTPQGSITPLIWGSKGEELWYKVQCRKLKTQRQLVFPLHIVSLVGLLTRTKILYAITSYYAISNHLVCLHKIILPS